MGKSISWVDAVETGHRNVCKKTCQTSQQTRIALIKLKCDFFNELVL
jgi:hypothetical protein